MNLFLLQQGQLSTTNGHHQVSPQGPPPPYPLQQQQVAPPKRFKVTISYISYFGLELVLHCILVFMMVSLKLSCAFCTSFKISLTLDLFVMLQTETPEVPGRMPLVTPPPAPAPATPTPSFYLNQNQLQMLQVLQQNAANLNPQQQVKLFSHFTIVITSLEIIPYFLFLDFLHVQHYDSKSFCKF